MFELVWLLCKVEKNKEKEKKEEAVGENKLETWSVFKWRCSAINHVKALSTQGLSGAKQEPQTKKQDLCYLQVSIRRHSLNQDIMVF